MGKQNEKQNEETKGRYMQPVSGSKCSTQRKETKHEASGRKEETRQKSRQPGDGGDLSACKQETGERKEHVKRSNSREGGEDLSATPPTQKNIKKLRVNNFLKKERKQSGQNDT